MVYKGAKPARDGTVPREITTPRLEGAKREHLPEAGQGNLWVGSPERSYSLWCGDAASLGSRGSQGNSILTLFPSPQALPVTLTSRAQPEAKAQGHTGQPPEAQKDGEG